MRDDRQFPTRPFVGVGGIVFKGRDVLLVRRVKPPRAGQWSIPGGAQKVGETVRDTLAREVAEETGVTVGAALLVDVFDSIVEDGGRVAFHYTLIDFVAPWTAGEAEPGGDADAVAWVAVDDLAAYGLWSETERAIAAGAKLLGVM